jgi:hypothetical protein
MKCSFLLKVKRELQEKERVSGAVLDFRFKYTKYHWQGKLRVWPVATVQLNGLGELPAASR